MERRDYLMRQIEKIGAIMNAIGRNIFGGRDNTALLSEEETAEAKAMLLNDLHFDLDHFLKLNMEESNQYLESFEGFNIENTEQLAECIAQMGFSDKSDGSKAYLEKALQLYELIKIKGKTYSFERESRILRIKGAL